MVLVSARQQMRSKRMWFTVRGSGFDHATVAEQGVDARLAATEGFEGFDGWA